MNGPKTRRPPPHPYAFRPIVATRSGRRESSIPTRRRSTVPARRCTPLPCGCCLAGQNARSVRTVRWWTGFSGRRKSPHGDAMLRCLKERSRSIAVALNPAARCTSRRQLSVLRLCACRVLSSAGCSRRVPAPCGDSGSLCSESILRSYGSGRMVCSHHASRS
jgi:hypothetical protein